MHFFVTYCILNYILYSISSKGGTIIHTKLRSQKMNLFLYYALLILIILSVCFSIFYIYYRENIYQEASTQSNNLCASISSSMVSELDKISTISMNIIYSNTIRKNFKDIQNIHYEQTQLDENYAFSRESVLNIYDTITAIIGPFQSATQINLYTLTGTCIGSGFYQYTQPIHLPTLPWYEHTIKNNGNKYITSPQYFLDMPSLDSILRDHKFISLCRLFFDDSNTPTGIVEVIQDCDILFSFINQVAEANPTMSFYIYNDRGEVVYPYQFTPSPIPNYPSLIRKDGLVALQSYTVTPKESSETVLLTYMPISKFDWQVVVTQPRTELLTSLRSFTKVFIFMAVIALLITSFLCFFVASKLNEPLHKLSCAIKQVNINHVLEKDTSIIPYPHSPIEEIHDLFNAFTSMYHKLCSSSEELINIKSEETRAKMLATQSMINPHFLYNNLTNISILAEENMNDTIIYMCHALCDYFRYITTHDEASVTLEKELLYTEKYIGCMHIRYGSDFNYIIDIPDALKSLTIPKLILQPLVENAFKYGFETAPPWQLTLSGEILQEKWLLHVIDNGAGMSQEAIRALLQTLKEVEKNREISSLKIGGMGLKNVYLRLLLLYNKEAIFTIDSTLNQGTCLTIGGPIFTKEVCHEYH